MSGWRNRIVGYGEESPDQLLANPRNWRVHPKFQQDALAGVLDEVGWVDDVIVNKTTGYVVDGHLRVAMAISKGVKAVPVKYVELSEDEEAKVMATLDPIGALAVADAEVLADLLAQVRTEDEAVQRLLDEVAAGTGVRLSSSDRGPMLEAADALQQKWQVSIGDIWQAGRHFIICGDARESDTWEKLLAAAGVEKVDGVFTSPPYAEQRKQYGGIAVDEYVGWFDAVQREVGLNLVHDGSFFVNLKPHCIGGERSLYVFDLILSMKREWGWRFIDEFCWIHQGYPGSYKYRFKNEFEPIFEFTKHDLANLEPYMKDDDSSEAILQFAKGSTPIRPGNVGEPLGEYHSRHIEDLALGRAHRKAIVKGATAESGMGNFFYYKNLRFRRPGNVVKVTLGDVTGGKLHPAVFPVGLPAFFIRGFSDRDSVWLDNFLGSGTTIVSCEQFGRRGLGIELVPAYVAATLERLSAMGLEVKLCAQAAG